MRKCITRGSFRRHFILFYSRQDRQIGLICTWYLHNVALHVRSILVFLCQWPISSRTANVWKGQSPLQSPIVAKFLKASGKAASLYINMVKYIYVLSLCLFIYNIGYYLSISLNVYLSLSVSIYVFLCLPLYRHGNVYLSLSLYLCIDLESR